MSHRIGSNRIMHREFAVAPLRLYETAFAAG